MTEAERKYTFSQSQQLSMQTGLIGYLRADFGSTGNEFWTTWNDFRKDLKTDEFKAEFDDVINGLRDGDVLSGRKAMSSYCYSTPDSSFNDDRNHYNREKEPEPIVPAWEQKKKSKVKSFDLHPDIPMAERHNFDLANNQVEEVNKKERFHRNYAAIKVFPSFFTSKRPQALGKEVFYAGY